MDPWQRACSISLPLEDREDRTTSSSLKANITKGFESLPKISLFKVYFFKNNNTDVWPLCLEMLRFCKKCSECHVKSPQVPLLQEKYK